MPDPVTKHGFENFSVKGQFLEFSAIGTEGHSSRSSPSTLQTTSFLDKRRQRFCWENSS